MTPPPFAAALSRRVREWAAALRDITAEARGHRLGAEAARIAYFGFLSFFPAILLVLAVTGIVGGERVFDRFVAGLQDTLPGVASASLERFVEGVRQTPRPGLLSAGAVLLLWSASNAVSALTLALNASFGGGPRRSWWRRRALSILVTAVCAAGFAVGSAAQVAGPGILREIGLGGLSSFWGVLRGPLVFTVLTAATFLLYRYLPNVSAHRSRWPLLLGATAGMALWMTATLLFRLFLHSFSRLGTVYGVMSGVIAIQIWIYLAALGVLLGAEVAAALERRFGRGDGPAREAPRPSEIHEHPEPPRLQKENT
jgi:membrane protein